MDLLKQTKKLCRLYNIKPVRQYGQNFLISEEVYNKMAVAAELSKDDTVLEIGPGLGFLTVKLARQARQVVTVEVDKNLTEVLQSSLLVRQIRNVKVINNNILKLNFNDLVFYFICGLNKAKSKKTKVLEIKSSLEKAIKNSEEFSVYRNGLKMAAISSYKIVANLPYNITSHFLRKFLTAKIKPSLMVLMLQKEVAERICAQPPKMSLLAVSVQFYARPRILKYVSQKKFWPQPEVDSAIVKIEVKKEKPEVNEKKFFQLVKFGFSARRKMLKNNLAAGYQIKPAKMEKWLKLADLDLNVRAQNLSLNNWLKLFGILKKNML
jgi:16S rRNA (adenine1518-N6/adenine1519-N6)-dimethyltransferase